MKIEKIIVGSLVKLPLAKLSSPLKKILPNAGQGGMGMVISVGISPTDKTDNVCKVLIGNKIYQFWLSDLQLIADR